MANKNSGTKYVDISIPAPLAEKIKKRMEGTGFTSISSYVVYILREVLSSIEAEEQEREAFSKEEEKKVKERLRNLGYID
ncbi:MAG: CopG family transcriptional regulator [Candidatus Helarchaeota archaeon]